MHIGQTKLPFKVYFGEHKSNVKYGNIKRSAIANHCASNNNNLNFSEVLKIQKFSSIYDRYF